MRILRRRARSRKMAMLGTLSALAAFGGWGCPGTSSISNGKAISGAEFAYVTNQSDNTVSAYTVDANAGTLRSIGTTNVGKSPSKVVSVSLGAKRNYVYVMSAQDSTISQFAVSANGTLTPLTPATVATGGVPTDMTLGADGTPYSGFSGGNTASDDNREFRLYVTTRSSLMRVFGINADGRLASKNDVHFQSTPLVVNVSGPDYPIYAADGTRYAPHDLDKSVTVLELASALGKQYSTLPLAQGGVTSAPPLTLSGEITPSALAGTDTALAVGEGAKSQVSFYNQALTRNALAQGAASSTFVTQGKPTSIASAGVYQLNSYNATITKEYFYVATVAGLVYQFAGDGTPLSDDLLNSSNALPPIQTHSPQNLFVKAYRGRLYVVRAVDHEVTSYAIKNESHGSDTLPATDNGRLLDGTAQSAQTGHNPAAITFLNTSLNSGAVQTTIH